MHSTSKAWTHAMQSTLVLLLLQVLHTWADYNKGQNEDGYVCLKRDQFPDNVKETEQLSCSYDLRDPSSLQLTEFSKIHGPGSITVTSPSGKPLESLTASLTVGPYGPTLFQDIDLIQGLSHVAREKIPERLVHAKGAGAEGYFEVTENVTHLTKAAAFKPGSKWPVVVRFSTVAGGGDSADTLRDARGLAVKFQTNEGVFDLLTLNTPVFFIRDPMLFPQLLHTHKKNPVTNLHDADAYWDFAALRPEVVHALMYVFGDTGTPDGYRHIHGFGGNPYKLVNYAGETQYCKFHLKSNQGLKNLSAERAMELAGSDPDYATRDLYDAIARKNYPSWTLAVQIMKTEEAENFPWIAFDVTKVWPEEQYPLYPVGILTLTQNVKDYFRFVEQAAFSPTRLIPGIELTSDKVLQGRSFIYPQTQMHRLGTNFQDLEVNRPRYSRVVSMERAGAYQQRMDDGYPSYYPTSFTNYTTSSRAATTRFNLSDTVGRYDSRDNDNFSQPRTLWLNMLEDERQRLVANIAADVKNASPNIQARVVDMFKQVHIDFGQKLHEELSQYNTCCTKSYRINKPRVFRK